MMTVGLHDTPIKYKFALLVDNTYPVLVNRRKDVGQSVHD
jgi:hypothetical protein